MSKRKQSGGEDSESDSSDVSLIDVDFDFFDPNPKVDYQALKRLLTQLLRTDAEAYGIDLHALTELVLGQPTVGTTIKTDGIDSDPYAFLTVLNMHVHHEHPSIKAIAHYALEKASVDPAFHSTLQALFSQNDSHVGLVLSERLINMPVQVIPPMYTMLSREVQWAMDDGEPYAFSHYLFISRTYHLTPEEESVLANSAPATKGPTSKKSKRATTQPVPETSPDGVYPYHPEDDCIKMVASYLVDYRFKVDTSEPREKDSFGLDTRGRIMLVPAARLGEVIAKMSELYAYASPP